MTAARNPWFVRAGCLAVLAVVGSGCKSPEERGYPPRPAVLEAASGRLPGVRQNLIEILGAHPDADLRELAARDLAMFPGPDVEAALAQTLSTDPEDDVRRQAARSLVAIAGVSGVPALRQTLIFDIDTEVRRLSAVALGRLGAVQAIPDLRCAAHQDPKSSVRQASREALRMLGAPFGPPPGPRPAFRRYRPGPRRWRWR